MLSLKIIRFYIPKPKTGQPHEEQKAKMSELQTFDRTSSTNLYSLLFLLLFLTIKKKQFDGALVN